jgi:RNA polymerase sigma-70 factor (ECF subfamily)
MSAISVLFAHCAECEFPDLIARIAQGDQHAMERLHMESKQALTIYVWRILRDNWTTEEVVQDIYRHVWLNAAAFSNDRGTPSAWLYNIARSRALDTLRRTCRRSAHVVFGEPPEPPPVWALRELPRDLTLSQCIETLSPDRRRLIQLAFFEGYTHTEIADRTGLPLGTVKTRVRMALDSLRVQLTRVPVAQTLVYPAEKRLRIPRARARKSSSETQLAA